MSFAICAAASIGRDLLNGCITYEAVPPSLDYIHRSVANLFTAERQKKGLWERFEPIIILIRKAGQWDELSSVTQLYNGCQLMAFDTNSPPPTEGPMPRPSFVVTAARLGIIFEPGPRTNEIVQTVAPVTDQRTSHVVEQVERSTQTAVPETEAAAATSLTTNDNPHSPANFLSKGLFGVRERPREKAIGPLIESADRSSARMFLFQKLCERSNENHSIDTDASASDASNTSSTACFPVHLLHAVFVQNDMFFPTDVFARMTRNASVIGLAEWRAIEHGYCPVLDVLCDRLSEKARAETNLATGERYRQQLQQQLDALLEEEAAINIRRATIKQEISRLQQAQRSLESETRIASENRAKEWDILSKFVALRSRQDQLHQEELEVTHQLSLL